MKKFIFLIILLSGLVIYGLTSQIRMGNAFVSSNNRVVGLQIPPKYTQSITNTPKGYYYTPKNKSWNKVYKLYLKTKQNWNTIRI